MIRDPARSRSIDREQFALNGRPTGVIILTARNGRFAALARLPFVTQDEPS